MEWNFNQITEGLTQKEKEEAILNIASSLHKKKISIGQALDILDEAKVFLLNNCGIIPKNI